MENVQLHSALFEGEIGKWKCPICGKLNEGAALESYENLKCDKCGAKYQVKLIAWYRPRVVLHGSD